MLLIISLDGMALQRVQHMKRPGLRLDTELSLKCDINYIVKKINLGIGVLYQSRNCFSFTVRKKLALQLILPILDYADVVHQAASKSFFSKIFLSIQFIIDYADLVLAALS